MGTNALRLLVAQIEPPDVNAKENKQLNPDSIPFSILDRARLTTGLGHGLATASVPRLTPEAQARAREAVGELRQRAAGLGARQILLLATHACRQALNGQEFVGELARTFNLNQAKVISAQEEARLTRLGVSCFLRGEQRDAWVLDIGAGSCELAPMDGKGEGLYLPWGCLTLKEKLAPSEPPLANELAAVRSFLAPHLKISRPARRLVITSGTASALAALDMGLSRYEPELINNYRVSGKRLAATLAYLSRQSLSQRRLILGPAADRAEVIVVGLLIAQEILNSLLLRELTVLDAGILEGCVLDYLHTAPRPELSF
jgi:exopolyphosphatase/guanosine-5'-triphosphate,3'-diphosphate pyrophosphatase